MEFSIPQQSIRSAFKDKYDQIQRQLQSIAAMDDLLSGSKQMQLHQMLYSQKYWRGIIFGELAVLQAHRKNVIRQLFSNTNMDAPQIYNCQINIRQFQFSTFFLATCQIKFSPIFQVFQVIRYTGT